MSLWILEKELSFPPPNTAEPDGLLAIGGDLSPDRLLLAYKMGIFPWYEGDHILWWSPNPRFVLFPEELIISSSMKKLFRKNLFRFTINQAFDKVIEECRSTKRKDQDGTWITPEVKEAYMQLHRLGHAHSAECWLQNELVGGVYGIRMGKFFFGESMFSHESNASKFAFIRYVQTLVKEGLTLVDCQVYSEHLESLGARMIPREEFVGMLSDLM